MHSLVSHTCFQVQFCGGMVCWTFDLKVSATALSLNTQVYKWVLLVIMLGGNLAVDWHPIQGGVAILLVA